MKSSISKLNFSILFLAIIFFFTGIVYASDTQEDLSPKEAKQEFAGIKFGVGVSLTIDTGNNDRIDEVKLVNNTVRVTSESNDIPRIILESHYFFPFTFKNKTCGWGPFVAVQPGTEDIIEAMGLGLMVGVKKNQKGNSSWNIGVGAVVDPNVKILGDDIKENKPLPTGETDVRLKETSQWGVLIITSFGF